MEGQPVDVMTQLAAVEQRIEELMEALSVQGRRRHDLHRKLLALGVDLASGEARAYLVHPEQGRIRVIRVGNDKGELFVDTTTVVDPLRVRWPIDMTPPDAVAEAVNNWELPNDDEADHMLVAEAGKPFM